MTFIIEPYLHIYDTHIYNPLTDQTLLPSHDGYTALRAGIAGQKLNANRVSKLVDDGWMVAKENATDTRFLLKYVSLEANIACNQACYFCPVSLEKRDDNILPLEFYEAIVQQLLPYRDTILGVFMNHYNEPTIDRYFLDRIRILKKYDFDIGLLTNGTGLTPKRIDAINAMGGIRHLCINLSTVDQAMYQQDRQVDHLEVVLRHLDYVNQHPTGGDMVMVVLGLGDEQHDQNYAKIKARYSASNFDVRYEIISSRGYYLPIGQKPSEPIQKLAGCEQTGSRILQHLHITAEGKAILCCQDYHAKYVVGDLREETIDDILRGERMATMRRWVYGRDDAPDNFICRHCVFALRR